MTTLTKRNRRVEASAETRGHTEQSDVRRDPDDEEEEDTDSKSLRLTLMEEILLLGIKDKEVSADSIFKPHLYNVMKTLFCPLSSCG